MSPGDVKEVLDLALEKTGVDKIKVRHRPRLLSDNGPCNVSEELKEYLKGKRMLHTRGAPYHPMTQGKIERYHRSMKNVVRLENYYFPGELEKAIAEWVEQYNNERYHESLENVTPADVFFGRWRQVLTERDIIKKRTLQMRKKENLSMAISAS